MRCTVTGPECALWVVTSPSSASAPNGKSHSNSSENGRNIRGRIRNADAHWLVASLSFVLMGYSRFSAALVYRSQVCADTKSKLCDSRLTRYPAREAAAA